MTGVNEMILAQDDPFEFVYEAITGVHGVEIRDYIQEMYNDVVIDCGYHPDDDFEEIISRIIDLLEDM